MGPLRAVYNVTSNISDDSSPRDSESPLANGGRANGSFNPDGTATTSSSPPWFLPFWRYVPYPIQKPIKAVIVWCQGPDPPRPWSIKPFFPAFQTAPLRLLDRYCPKRRHRILLLAFFYFCWLLTFATVLHHSGDSEHIKGYGKPTLIDCTSTYWFYKNECGTNGDQCRPFTNNSFAFRCPGSCKSVEVLNPHAVGPLEPNYRPLVIGGPKDGSTRVGDAIYRGDSFICGAAIHAGFITDAEGGCGVVELVGQGIDYPSVRQHGIESIPFDSSFPMSFKFLPGTRVACTDLRWAILGITIAFTTLLSIFTTSPAVFFMSIFTSLYFHIALVSDPPRNAGLYALTATALKGFLPASFIAFVGYKYCAYKTLNGLQAQFEKTILYLGACWVGALTNYTFDKIPLQRLTPHDINQQPGAITALVIIVIILLIIVIGQVWAFRVAGLMPRYLGVYGIMVFLLLMFLAIPHLNLRIHHYILAILLFPGTSLQNRPCLLYQGLLLGLFLNGVARWGFASILQTSAELQADAQFGSGLPKIADPVIHAANITFDWRFIPADYDGISVLVNDVERLRDYGNQTTTFTWTRAIEGYPEYFRFGYMIGTGAQDYTKAGTWHANGTWTKMKPGPS